MFHRFLRAALVAAAPLMAAASPAFAKEKEGGGGWRRGHGSRAPVQAASGAAVGAAPGQRFAEPERRRSAEAPVVMKMRRVRVPQPKVISDPAQVVRDHRRVPSPRTDNAGARIRQHEAVHPPSHHSVVINNKAVVSNIAVQQRIEVAPGRYYWHHDHGVRYAHYYDRHRVHWYGFYHGPRFYWTRYHSGYWWWWDVRFSRWVYWWGGRWWWPGPAGVVYVYVDNSYYPYDGGVVTVKHPEVQAPPVEAPKAAASGGWKSPDGRRSIQIAGSFGDAFLYDSSGAQPVLLKFIGRDIEKARFTGGGASGKPLQILAEFKDGTFAVFDADGNPLDAPASPAAAEVTPSAAPPQPESIPPPPGSAPGETEPAPSSRD
ncbi:MAG: hypothetical protein HY078_11540 [Elusimicrobia bacterium]|nr:hypothetical protein [Elusimicrobiota bacterium]